MSGADDARQIDDALLRAFCAVQALCAGAIGIAYPAVLCALAIRELSGHMHPGLPHIARFAFVLRPLILSRGFRIHPLTASLY